ncbi:MAG: hypothetical protein ABI432_06840 [Flavobacteriales bacterium]
MSNAQHWKAMGKGPIGGEVGTLFGDSMVDHLLAGGEFQHYKNEVDTVLVYGIAAWNGTRWDSLAHRIAPGEGLTHWFLRYQGDLYACGGWGFDVGSETNWGLARLNQDTQYWEALECINSFASGISTLVPKEPQGTLYATGYLGSLCGYPESCVFRCDGSAFHIWEPFQQIPEYSGNYVGCVFDYQGMTYMTGLFKDPLTSGSLSLARFNGTSWEHVPGWNTIAGIKEVSIRNDTLYVAGAFRESQGGPGNMIAAFDGQNWTWVVVWSILPLHQAALRWTSNGSTMNFMSAAFSGRPAMFR